MIRELYRGETYRFARSTRFWMYTGSVLLAVGAVAAAVEHQPDGLLLLPFAVLGLRMSIETSGKATVTESGIQYKKPFCVIRTIQWQDIVDLKEHGLLSRLEIRSRGADSLYLPNQLEGFTIILETLRRHRPDLFTAHGRTHFHRKAFVTFFMCAFGVMVLGLVLFLPGGVDEQWARVVLLGFAVLCPAALLFEVRDLVIEESYLRLKYPFRENYISRNDVQEVGLEQEARCYGTRSTIVALYRRDGKKIKLGGFREGDLEVHEALQLWLSTP